MATLERTEKGQEIADLFLRACYNGERFVWEMKDGTQVGIVPIEDVQVLEEIDA